MKQRDIDDLDQARYPDSKNPNSVKEGIEFQDFVCEQLSARGLVIQNYGSRAYQLHVGENVQGIEIKLDKRCLDTRRLSIEVAERTANDALHDWVDSGIHSKTRPWLYIQGNVHLFFVFATRFLLNYEREMLRRRKLRIHEKHGTVRTFYLDFEQASQHAAICIELTAGTHAKRKRA